ncbi:hypothetical protein AB0B28_03745 [Glycomyces sp. NPDC046736]|uniref:hypothetical protein n=1 Tax=Glycomyces sp. NPDC046736 TaxID=3155615 RepID=UPI0033E4F826
MSTRKFDPEAVAEYQAVLQSDLEYLEDLMIPRLRDGDLSYMPAFGLEGTAGKQAEYQASFASIWTDLQYVKTTMKRQDEALADIVKEKASTEDVNVAELEQYLTAGESVPLDENGDPDYNADLT